MSRRPGHLRHRRRASAKERSKAPSSCRGARPCPPWRKSPNARCRCTWPAHCLRRLRKAPNAWHRQRFGRCLGWHRCASESGPMTGRKGRGVPNMAHMWRHGFRSRLVAGGRSQHNHGMAEMQRRLADGTHQCCGAPNRQAGCARRRLWCLRQRACPYALRAGGSTELFEGERCGIPEKAAPGAWPERPEATAGGDRHGMGGISRGKRGGRRPSPVRHPRQ
jgi:hypothetical protein